MKRDKINNIIFSIIIIIIMLHLYIIKRVSVTSRISFDMKEFVDEDSIINIGIIGDSWAYNSTKYIFPQYLDSILSAQQIQSYTSIIQGIPGAKSKDIYIWLKNNIKNNPLKGYDYCILFCGINDLHGQYGKYFYSQHTLFIIDYLLNYGVKPIIIEIPFTHHLNLYNYYPWWKKYSYILLSLYTSNNINLDNLNIYRSSLEEKIQNINNNIIYIKTDKILNKGHLLYLDDIHINQNGYIELGINISQCIIKDIYENSH